MRIPRLLFSVALVAASSCGQVEGVSASYDRESDREFEAVRAEAGVLIGGTVWDWKSASDEAKNVYALGSVDALSTGLNDADRAMYARVFRRCMDEDVARSTSGKSLGDLSYSCAVGIRYALSHR